MTSIVAARPEILRTESQHPSPLSFNFRRLVSVHSVSCELHLIPSYLLGITDFNPQFHPHTVSIDRTIPLAPRDSHFTDLHVCKDQA
jgi:hypothetical protein